MKDTYIVAFPAGASGRFVSAIVYALLHNSTENITWTAENSAHDFVKHRAAWDTGSTHPKHLLNSRDFYSKFSFRESGVVQTHVPPDFDILQQRLPDTKVIVISFDDLDFFEIKYNVISKNTVGIDGKGPYIWWTVPSFQIDFLNYHTVPDNALLIKYRELFEASKDSFVGLEKLKAYTNRPSNAAIDKSYADYVANRQQIAAQLPTMQQYVTDAEKQYTRLI